MKVLQVHCRYRQAGGEDNVVLTEAELLRDAGHDVVTHLAANPDGRLAASRALAAAPWNVASARQVQEVAEKSQPDVVHVHNTWFGLSPAIFSSFRNLGIPVVLTLHNYRLICAAATLLRDGAPCHDCVGTHPWHAVRHRCYRDSRPQSAVAAASIAVHQARRTWHRDVDRFLALTEFGRRRFIEGGLPAGRIEVKSNAVRDPGPRSHPPSASNKVLFVGRLSAEKGITSLLEAWRSLPLELELVVVGDGPLRSALTAMPPERVTFLGAVPAERVEALMLEARALVFPSVWYEGQPLVPIEAAAAGLPVLLSDLGAMSELFAPGQEALTFEPGDVAGLRTALSRLEDDNFADSYGAFARRRFDERYTYEIATRRLEQIYREVVAGGSEGRPGSEATSR